MPTSGEVVGRYLRWFLAALSAAAGLVHWPEAITMMLATAAGGYAGAPLARALPRGLVRGIIAAIGFGMSAAFLLRLLR